MGILLVAVLFGAALMASVAGAVALCLHGAVTRQRRPSWFRAAAIALLLSGLFALAAFIAFTRAHPNSAGSMTESFELAFRGTAALGASGGFGLTALIAALMGLSSSPSRKPHPGADRTAAP